MRLQTSLIPVPAGFSLAQAVCSYGFFVLSPNKWRPQVEQTLDSRNKRSFPIPRISLKTNTGEQGEATQPVLERPLQLGAGRRARVELTQPDPNTLKLSAADGEALTPASWSKVHLQAG